MFKDHAKKTVSEIFSRPVRVADVGIEIEIEGYGFPESVKHWQHKSEGSLQDGIEYITKPIKFADVDKYVDTLATTLKGYGTKLKPSYRCSTHIHVNYLQETVADMLASIVIWTMYEPLILSLCGPQRDGNLFCLSSYDTGDLTSAFDRMCYQFHHIKERGFLYERGKYAALNTGRLVDLGTLEARCFPFSLDGAQVKLWAQWLMSIRDTAKSLPDKTVREYWKNVRANPGFYVAHIFGSAGLAHPQALELVDYGTEQAYELTKVLKTWYNKDTAPTAKKARIKKPFIDPGPLTFEEEVQW